MATREIDELVAQAKAGSKQAFEQLCRRKSQSIIYFCVKLMNGEQDGYDAAQEVFLKMQLNIAKLQTVEAFSVWLHKIIVHTCDNMRRKEAKNRGMLPLEEYCDNLPSAELEMLPEEYILTAEKQAQLLKIIDDLPQTMRSCVLLYYYEGLKTTEIAAVLDISANAVNIQLHRARLKMRIAITQQAPDSYTHALLPMSMLGRVLQSDAQARVTPEVISSVLLPLAKGLLSLPQKLFALALSGGIVLACTAVFLSSGTPAIISASASSPVVAVSVVSDPQRIQQHSAAGDEYEDILSQEEPDAPAPPVPDFGQDELDGQFDYNEPLSFYAQGDVVMLDAFGQQSAPASFVGGTVELCAPDGSKLASTGINSDGGFLFDMLAGQLAGDYTLRLVLPQGSALAAAQQHTVLRVRAGQTQYTAQLYAAHTKSAWVHILLQGGECDCGHVNPKVISLTTFNCPDGAKLSWRIEDADGNIVLRGDVAEINGELAALYTSAPQGMYTLYVGLSGAAPDTVTASQALRIVRGAVDENQYA